MTTEQRPPDKRLTWWRRWLCALRDHAGIDNDNRCKRCGSKVKVSPW